MKIKNFLLLLILSIFSLSLWNVGQKISEGKKRLLESEREVAATIRKKEDLQKEIAQKQSLDYLEREARDRLNLIKPGERIVILPPRPDGQESGDKEIDQKDSTPNWLKWKRLFFD